MQLADIDFQLPAELIAQAPTAERTSSRLLDLSEGALVHRAFAELVDLLQPADLLVVNDTRVLKARLRGVKDSGGAAEILLERIVAEQEALCQVKVSKPLGIGRTLAVGDTQLTVLGREGQFYRLGFPTAVESLLAAHGELPLPPYIDPAASDTRHEDRYQTVYAAVPGAVAAPTAGLHFSRELLAALAARGVTTARITLHVGAGTFQPVRGEDLDAHEMHNEVYRIPAATRQAIQACRGRVVAVGTTVVRALEAAALDGALTRGSAPVAGDDADHHSSTRLFIRPGFEFQIVDRLITNFHLPRSTLLLLVCAFAGQERVLPAYEVAVRERYRFFSYGDAMLLDRATR